MRRATKYQFDTQTTEIKICSICLQMLWLIKIKDIHQCEDTDHVYAIVRTGPQVTHMVPTGDLVPAGIF